MLKFFRRIRRRLIAEGNLKRYLVYAIGEILLVMIGILLALQVNNWNEIRKDRAEEIIALKDLREEFQASQKLFLSRQADKNESEIKWASYLKKIMNKQLPLSERAIPRIYPGVKVTDISNSTLNALLSSGKIDQITNDSLKHLLFSWKDLFNDYHEKEVEHWEFVKNKLYDYERQLFPTFDKGPYEKVRFYKDFYSEEELNKFLINAYEDMVYKNLLISNHAYLVQVLENGEIVGITFSEIIRLINDEIESKTN